MDRKGTTRFLGDLLKADKLSGMCKYWASEVSIDYGHADKVKRVDFMQFQPPDQCSLSSLEKGIFTCYEIKSCVADAYSGNGLNFIGEKNYIVTTMECYKKLLPDIRTGKFKDHLHQNFPESSDYYGFMVAIPRDREETDEYENPTPIPEDGCINGWKLDIILPCRQGPRYRSITELLFCMLRSGRY